MGNNAQFGAAVAVLIEHNGKILLCRRSTDRNHGANEWEAGVTGGIESGETPEQSALREVKEETQLDVTLIAPFNTFHFYRGSERVEHVGISFWATSESDNVTIDSHEHSEYRWATPEEALEIIEQPWLQDEIRKFLDFKSRYRL